MIVDLYAGPGGWDEGLALLGVHDVLGIEWDDAACATAEAAGHRRLNADVAALDPADFPCEGLIASPPCQAFSLAGKGAGRGAIDRLLAHVHACADGWTDPPESICGEDVRADLTLQPLRWVDALRPTWVACEQVPAALPLWQAIGYVLEGWGYRTWAGLLSAEQFGVPQTRKRAFLMAARDGRPVGPPAPTHTKYEPRLDDGGKHDPGGLFGSLEPWVSMAQALGWEMEERPSVAVMAGSGRQGGADPLDGGSGARETMRREREAGRWVAYVDGNQENAAVRPADEPAPTVHFGAAMNDVRWVHDRPSTTVTGHNRISEPGHRCMAEDCCGRGIQTQYGPDAVRVTVTEAAILQSFRTDYPWQGSKTKQYEQVGNAVPPLLAKVVLTALKVDAQEVGA